MQHRLEEAGWGSRTREPEQTPWKRKARGRQNVPDDGAISGLRGEVQRQLMLPGPFLPPPRPPALTGHVQLQSLGELGVLGGVIVFHPAAIGPTLAPLHPLQGQVPVEVGAQYFFLVVLCEQKGETGFGSPPDLAGSY